MYLVNKVRSASYFYSIESIPTHPLDHHMSQSNGPARPLDVSELPGQCAQRERWLGDGWMVGPQLRRPILHKPRLRLLLQVEVKPQIDSD